jgi:shikimate 5-dehydrogenase
VTHRLVQLGQASGEGVIDAFFSRPEISQILKSNESITGLDAARDRLQEEIRRPIPGTVIRLWGPLQAEVFQLLKETDRRPREVGAIQALSQIGGGWKAHNIEVDAFRAVAAKQRWLLDTKAPGLVLGSTPLARSALHFLAQAGYRRLYLMGDDPAVLAELSKSWSKTVLGSKLLLLTQEALLQLQVSCSIAINTISPLDEGRARELAYFSFLRRQSFWFDLGDSTRANLLESEALALGAQIPPPLAFYQERERLFVQTVLKVPWSERLGSDLCAVSPTTSEA